MTLKKLKNYRMLCVEIQDLKTELENQHVLTSNRIKLTSEEVELILNRLKVLETDRTEIQNFILDVHEYEVKKIMILRYQKGLSWIKVGFSMGSSADACRMRVKRYFEKL